MLSTCTEEPICAPKTMIYTNENLEVKKVNENQIRFHILKKNFIRISNLALQIQTNNLKKNQCLNLVNIYLIHRLLINLLHFFGVKVDLYCFQKFPLNSNFIPELYHTSFGERRTCCIRREYFFIWQSLRFPLWDYVWKTRKGCNSLGNRLECYEMLCFIITKVALTNEKVWIFFFFFF